MFHDSNKNKPLIKSSFALRTLGLVNLLMNKVRTTNINNAINKIFLFMVISLKLKSDQLIKRERLKRYSKLKTEKFSSRLLHHC